MGLFVCDQCGCVENTALGRYWDRDIEAMGGDDGRALCSECSEGKWHGRFEKLPWDGQRTVINRGGITPSMRKAEQAAKKRAAVAKKRAAIAERHRARTASLVPTVRRCQRCGSKQLDDGEKFCRQCVPLAPERAGYRKPSYSAEAPYDPDDSTDWGKEDD